MGKVSIIVPVYNKEAYLERCVESILQQTCPDFDLILVDDGSTDSCGEICDRYEKQDSRITVIHQANRGLSLARNMGIHYACTSSISKWISFLDADDALHPRFLEIMLSESEKKSNSIVACRLRKINPGEKISEISNFPVQEIDLNYLYSEKGKTMSGLSACGKLFPKDIFIRIRFPAGLHNEDMYATPILMKEAEQIVFIDAGMYYYYMLADSYIHMDWQPKKLEELYAAEFVARFLKNNDCPDAHYGTLCRILWIIKRQRAEIRKSKEQHKTHFLIYLIGKEFEIRRRIRRAKKSIRENSDNKNRR